MKKISTFLILSAITLFGLTSCQKELGTGPTAGKLPVNPPGSGTGHFTLALRPLLSDGGVQDCLVGSLPAYASVNLVGNPDIAATQWTYNGVQGTLRDYFEFTGLSSLPSGTSIDSATLKLYGLAVNTGSASPQGNSYYPGSPYDSYGDNSCWIKRVTGYWNEDSITWNNKPSTIDSNKVAVSPSTSQWNYNVSVNVTSLVRDIVNSGHNYGFCLQLQNESIYRGLNFAGSRNTDSTRWPKLVITYTL
jgi:hypothetical protein